MGKSRTLKLALLSGAAVMLQGCVAAVIPLAAGGLMGGSGFGRNSEDGTSLASATVIDPTVTVETPQRASPVTAIAAPQAPLAAASNTELAAPGPMSEAVAETIASAAPIAVPKPELTSISAAPAFASEAPQPSIASAETAGFSTTTQAPAISAVEPQAAPTTVQPPANPAPLRMVAVDRQTALGEPLVDPSSVSAADAAAALASLPAANEPAPDTSALARTETRPRPVSANAPVAAPAAANAASVEVPPPPQSVSSRPALSIPSQRPSSPAAAMDSAASANAITALLSYANQSKFTSNGPRSSAVLSDRIALEPKRAACNALAPTVLIDLDPDGGLLAPENAGRPPAGLGLGLARLRASGVNIAWISGNPESRSGEIREALERSGLDLKGDDRLLLMRDSTDRKQVRRQELAGITCLIAIAGDARSDFDELYNYLLNPSDADLLEPLIDDGWFLIPLPLIEERPNL